MDIINIIAVITAPIIAVWVGQHLQNLTEKRKDKMQIFKTLMTSRIYGQTIDSVHALNSIDIVFEKDKNVRKAWKELFEKYSVGNIGPNERRNVENAEYKLLEAMAISLGYKNKITWENIQNPYIPKWMTEQQAKNKAFQDGQLAFAQMFVNQSNDNSKNRLKDEKQK